MPFAVEQFFTVGQASVNMELLMLKVNTNLRTVERDDVIIVTGGSDLAFIARVDGVKEESDATPLSISSTIMYAKVISEVIISLKNNSNKGASKVTESVSTFEKICKKST